MCRIRRRRQTKLSSPLSLLCSLSRCHFAFTLRGSYVSISTSPVTFSTPRCCSPVLLTRQSIFFPFLPVSLSSPVPTRRLMGKYDKSLLSPPASHLSNAQIRVLVKLLYLSYLLFHPVFASVYYRHQSLSHQQPGLLLYLLDKGP